MSAQTKQRVMDFVIQLAVSLILLFLALTFIPRSDVQAENIKILESKLEKKSEKDEQQDRDIIDLKLLISEQTAFQRYMKSAIERWENERYYNSNKKTSKGQ